MTLEDALGLIDRALASIAANRQDHIALQQAYALIAERVRETETVKD